DLRRAVHRAIRDVTGDLEDFRFNAAVARLMTLTNDLASAPASLHSTAVWDDAVDTLLLLMAPVVPHIAEELWQRRGRTGSVHRAAWPDHDAALAAEPEVEIALQVDGV